MATLRASAKALRSKNAGPFWVTVDVFFDSRESFTEVSGKLASDTVAQALHVAQSDLQRYDLPEINVIKFSFPRPVVQGHRFDRDMHGAQFALLLADIEV